MAAYLEHNEARLAELDAKFTQNHQEKLLLMSECESLMSDYKSSIKKCFRFIWLMLAAFVIFSIVVFFLHRYIVKMEKKDGC
jgi:hypothetical protein